MLIVATFERFLRDMFAEHLDRLAAQPPPVPFDDLPEELRINSVFMSLDQGMRGRLPGGVTGKRHRLPALQHAAALIVDGRIDASALSQTGGNPNSNTVKELFTKVGVQDVFGRIRSPFQARWQKPEARDFVSAKLDEIVNSRHRVAHRADALNISRQQLADWPRFVKVLAELLDDELDGHVRRLVEGVATPSGP